MPEIIEMNSVELGSMLTTTSTRKGDVVVGDVDFFQTSSNEYALDEGPIEYVIQSDLDYF